MSDWTYIRTWSNMKFESEMRKCISYYLISIYRHRYSQKNRISFSCIFIKFATIDFFRRKWCQWELMCSNEWWEFISYFFYCDFRFFMILLLKMERDFLPIIHIPRISNNRKIDGSFIPFVCTCQSMEKFSILISSCYEKSWCHRVKRTSMSDFDFSSFSWFVRLITFNPTH